MQRELDLPWIDEREGCLRKRGNLCALFALMLAVGCGDVGETDVLTRPMGDAGDAGAAGTRPVTALDAGTGAAPTTVTTNSCNHVELAFESRRPTVMLLVDRSSSMFDNDLWEPLKAGVLEVVERLSPEVRFGFASYTGEQGGMCPDMTTVDATTTDNFAAIQRAYEALRSPPYKGETPTAASITRVTELLARDPDPGAKFILLVTDGEPDFCDDANVTCARDAVVAAAQDAYRQGIGALVFHVGGKVDRQHLEDVARAGSGETVEDRGGVVAQQCQSPRARYATAGGQGVLFEPDVNDRTALVGALSQAVAGLRSCVFELAGSVQIDPAAAAQGKVEIDGTPVPYGTPDGFRVTGPTAVELLGAACNRLRSQTTERVVIDFPCEALVVI